MPERVGIVEFLHFALTRPIIDVRTPREYERGHIPGAHNIPLLTKEERAMIGTLYKQAGREEAILAGLEAVGPKMRTLALQICELCADEGVLVHCWRGGMRSESVAWLASLFGYQSYTLNHGYKAFRHYVLNSFIRPQPILVLGGYSGSGKTLLLDELARQGEQVIDLEGLARHRGSAFGQLGEDPQPSQQQFENELAMQWQKLDSARPVWLEDESCSIGTVTVPKGIWQQMRAAPVLFLDISVAKRRDQLVSVYGQFDRAALAESICQIQRRLGGLAKQQALDALNRGDLATCAYLLLIQYYDKTYQRGLAKRKPLRLHHITSDTCDPVANASVLMELAATLTPDKCRVKPALGCD